MFKKFVGTALATTMALALVGCNSEATDDKAATTATAPAATEQTPAQADNLTFKDKVSIALASMFAKQFSENSAQFEELGQGINIELFKQTFIKVVDAKGEAPLSDEEMEAILSEFSQNLQKAAMEKRNAEVSANLKAGEEFLAANASKEGVQSTASGLQYKINVLGTGEKPAAEDVVRVTYKGTTIDGTVFDQSAEPVEFALNQVIAGWTEGLQLLPAGSEATLFIPAKLAYGENSPSAAIKPNSTLIFDVKLIEVKKAPKTEEQK